jgi:alpha-tubulin suppressor-like RCC1 family protein
MMLAISTPSPNDNINAPVSRIYCWGKGASGRLGFGRSQNRKWPTRVDGFPESIKEYSVDMAALGGAHTLVLCSKVIGGFRGRGGSS